MFVRCDACATGSRSLPSVTPTSHGRPRWRNARRGRLFIRRAPSTRRHRDRHICHAAVDASRALPDALRPRKYVVCEKPFVGSLADIDRLIAAEASAPDGRLMPIFQYRFGNGLQQVKALVDAGIAGQAYTSSVEVAWRRRADYYAVPWRGRARPSSAGCSSAKASTPSTCSRTSRVRRQRVVLPDHDAGQSDRGRGLRCGFARVRDGSLATISATLGSSEEVCRHRFHFAGFAAGVEHRAVLVVRQAVDDHARHSRSGRRHRGSAGGLGRSAGGVGRSVPTVRRRARRRHGSTGHARGCTRVARVADCAVLVGAHRRRGHHADRRLASLLRELGAMTRWTYNADHRKRPNVHPLAAPSGAVLTCDAPDDHPWHHGLWFTIKFVNEENFWEEMAPYGVLRHVDPTTVHWIRPDRETVVIVDRAIHRRGRPRCRRRVRDRLDDRARAATRRPSRPHTVHDLGWLRRPRAARAGPTGRTLGSCSPTGRRTTACSAFRRHGATSPVTSMGRLPACCCSTAPRTHGIPFRGTGRRRRRRTATRAGRTSSTPRSCGTSHSRSPPVRC